MPLPSLDDTLRALRRFAEPWPTTVEVRPKSLEQQLQAFQRTAQAAPPANKQDAVQWQQALAEDGLSDLPLAVSRRLAWDPAISLMDSYLNHLSEQEVRLDPRIQRGLLFSLASRWDELEGDLTRQRALSRRIAALFAQQGRPLPYPFAADDLAKLPMAIAQLAAAERLTPAQAAVRLLRLEVAATPLGIAATLETVHLVAHLPLSNEQADRDYFYHGLMNALRKPYVLQGLRLIAANVIDRGSVAAQGSLRQLILRHPDLGDPRLPTTGAYWDRTDPLRTKVATWLSREDIALFFRVFFREGEDMQGRKEFWMQYAGSVQGARVVYCPGDADLVRDLMSRYELQLNKDMFAKLTERTDSLGSAFIMHFGSAVVVEFSRVNSSTYLYDRKSRSTLLKENTFWESTEFSRDALKSVALATDRQPHRSGHVSWQSKFGLWLRGYGIVPGE